jgi:hypothetical protein
VLKFGDSGMERRRTGTSLVALVTCVALVRPASLLALGELLAKVPVGRYVYAYVLGTYVCMYIQLPGTIYVFMHFDIFRV